VRATYLERASREPHRFRVIDASGGVGDVETQVQRALAALLELPA